MLGPAAEADEPYRAWPIPTDYSPDALVDAGGRVLYAGDAARVVDPMTGEGIAQALETGMLAATAVADAGGVPEAVGARYRHRVERDLGRDLRFAALLQRVLRSPTGRARRHPGRRAHRLDPPELRPVDVRGLSARPRPHPRPLAPPRVGRV